MSQPSPLPKPFTLCLLPSGANRYALGVYVGPSPTGKRAMVYRCIGGKLPDMPSSPKPRGWDELIWDAPAGKAPVANRIASPYKGQADSFCAIARRHYHRSMSVFSERSRLCQDECQPGVFVSTNKPGWPGKPRYARLVIGVERGRGGAVRKFHAVHITQPSLTRRVPGEARWEPAPLHFAYLSRPKVLRPSSWGKLTDPMEYLADWMNELPVESEQSITLDGLCDALRTAVADVCKREGFDTPELNLKG